MTVAARRPMRRERSIGLTLAGLAAFAGLVLSQSACGPSNSLSGSISQSLPLDFTSVRLRQQGEDLLIEYLKDVTGGTMKVCKVVADGSKVPIKKNALIKGQSFLQWVSVTREATPDGPFPTVQSGQLKFDQAQFRAGGRVTGNFNAIFVDGRNVSGNFDGLLEEVNLQ